MAKISIVIPVYNGEKFLHRSINSVISQSFTDWEMIIVDDGSTDKSGNICDEYAQKETRINVIHKENGGLPAARNTGMQACMGEWIFFLDCDDHIPEHALANLYEVAQNNNADIVMGRHYKINIITGTKELKGHQFPDGKCFTKNEIIKEFIEKYFCAQESLKLADYTLPSGLYKKCFLTENNINFCVAQKFGEDVRFVLQALMVSNRVVTINAPVYLYMYDPSAVSTKYADKYHDSTIEAYKYWSEIIRKCKLSKHCYYNMIGQIYVGINSYILIATNRNTNRKKVMSFLHNKYMFKVLCSIVFMKKKYLFDANISNKDRVVALLYVFGFYKQALKLNNGEK